MDRVKLRRFERQTMKHIDEQRCSSMPSSPALSPHSSNSSLSSLLNSVCDISVNVNQCLTNIGSRPEPTAPVKRNSLEHTSFCKHCHGFNVTDQHETCTRCRDNQPVTRSESLPSSPPSAKVTPECTKRSMFSLDSKYPKRSKLRPKEKCTNDLQRQCLLRLVNSHREQLLKQPELSNASFTGSESSLSPIASQVQTPPHVSLSPERICHYKQRQADLDRTVRKLLDTLTSKSSESIEHIVRHWSHLKHLSLEQFRPKSRHLQLFGQLLDSSAYHKQSKVYLDEHDEIQEALRILQRVLSIFHERCSLATTNQLFDAVGESTLEDLRTQAELLVSSHRDELSFLSERAHFYESRLPAERTYEWAQCIQVEYPLLIEKISNDFVLRQPRIDTTLVQMLRNVKKQLLSSLLEKATE